MLNAVNVEVWIIANGNCSNTNGRLEAESEIVDRTIFGWYYDNKAFIRSFVEVDKVINHLQDYDISRLSIQYHVAFFTQEELVKITRRCRECAIDVTITLHNSKRIRFDVMSALVQSGAQLIVHNVIDKDRIERYGIKNSYYTPIGIDKYRLIPLRIARESLGVSRDPIIGSFGFLRSHKGVFELIDAIDVLRAKYPGILLLALNAVYPSEDSHEYFLHCDRRIRELGLEQYVDLRIGFLPVGTIVKTLQACNVIVLPYQDSDEGASATASMAIAARRPIVASRSRVFCGIEDLLWPVERVDGASIAAGIDQVLRDQRLRNNLELTVARYADRNSWSAVAEFYSDVIFG